MDLWRRGRPFSRFAQGKLQAKLVALITAFILAGSVFPLKAATSELRTFLEDLKKTSVRFNYLVMGLDSVSSVGFKKKYVAEYSPVFNRITLPDEYSDGRGNVRSPKKLMTMQMGTIAHEGFHAFKTNFIDSKTLYRKYKNWMQERSESLFQEVPRRDRELALEEAYATFLGQTVMTYLGVEKLLANLNEENCFLSRRGGSEMWAGNWKQAVYGYYYKGLVNQSDLALQLISTGVDQTNTNAKARDDVIYTKATLVEKDREWMAQHLFENKIGAEFEAMFGEKFKNFKCENHEEESQP